MSAAVRAYLAVSLGLAVLLVVLALLVMPMMVRPGAREGGFAVGALIYGTLGLAAVVAVQLAAGLLWLWLARGVVQLRLPALVAMALVVAGLAVALVRTEPWKGWHFYRAWRGDLGWVLDWGDRKHPEDTRPDIRRAVEHGAVIKREHLRGLLDFLDDALVDFLMAKGALTLSGFYDAQGGGDRTTVLAEAVKTGSVDSVRLLLRHGASPTTTEETTALAVDAVVVRLHTMLPPEDALEVIYLLEDHGVPHARIKSAVAAAVPGAEGFVSDNLRGVLGALK